MTSNQVTIQSILLGLVAFVASGIVTYKILFTVAQQELDELCAQNELGKLGFDFQMWSDPESESLKKLLQGIADYWDNRNNLGPYLCTLIDESLKNIESSLEMMTAGKIHFRWQDIRDVASEVLSGAGDGATIYSTSYVSTPNWWLDSTGGIHDYLIKKRDAAEAGAEVMQVFISPNPNALREAEGIVRELLKTTKGKKVRVYAISESRLTHGEKRDVLLLESPEKSLAFELDLKGISWVEGFYVYAGDELKLLKAFFDKLLTRSALVEFDEQKQSSFDDFVDEVFR